MRKTSFVMTALVALLAWALALPTFAASGRPAATDTSSITQPSLPQAYCLDFSVTELQSDKPVSSHVYSMTVNSDESGNLKIGARVPVATGNDGHFQYLDVGTNIWCRAQEREGNLILTVRSDLSSIDLGDAVKTVNQSKVHQVSINGSTVVASGKAALIGSVDDPTSRRQFRLQVIATRLR
jgi:hypothetical protein